MTKERRALEIFTEIVNEGAYANIALKVVQSDRDGRFIRALVYTSLEHLAHIDYILAAYARGRVNRQIRNILRLGVCQILFMSRPDSAVCNECVTLAREIGKGALSGYVNGVLRALARDKADEKLPPLPSAADERLSIESGYPLWLVREYIERFGEDDARKTLFFCDNSTAVRAQYPFTADELKKYLDESGITYRRGRLDENVFHVDGAGITETELFTEGKITIQSESSCVVCRSCGDMHGKKLLDACCAPGGKSAYIFSLSEGKCDITSCELHEHRKALTEATFARLNVKAEVICADMTEKHEEFREAFDVVLCDAPCSGLGVVGKPDARYRRDAGDVEEIAKVQHDILSACADYVKRGGMLVYSTCTVSRRENEAQTESFLRERDDFELIDERRIMPHTDGTDGFYIARFGRKNA